jgi:Spy/CpxP family protein refolding chaperone
MLQELGLTSDQLERLKRLQADLGQKNRVAQMRQREANKALDDAIYSDTATEEQIRELVRAAQEAANEAIRLRTLTELEMKKILTREQLIKFRELKKRFDRRQQMGPPPDGGRPPRRGQRPEN